MRCCCRCLSFLPARPLLTFSLQAQWCPQVTSNAEVRNTVHTSLTSGGGTIVGAGALLMVGGAFMAKKKMAGGGGKRTAQRGENVEMAGEASVV